MVYVVVFKKLLVCYNRCSVRVKWWLRRKAEETAGGDGRDEDGVASLRRHDPDGWGRWAE